MPEAGNDPTRTEAALLAARTTEMGRQNALLKAGALQNAILTSAQLIEVAQFMQALDQAPMFAKPGAASSTQEESQ